MARTVASSSMTRTRLRAGSSTSGAQCRFCAHSCVATKLNPVRELNRGTLLDAALACSSSGFRRTGRPGEHISRGEYRNRLLEPVRQYAAEKLSTETNW